ncbi:TPA: LLM class flavin-dependent oxidoreductase, partial [Klebsiella quasipneumoniae]|nr:LLM class flavin-dependent oxidoreductase [Klebsiella quasipneumoniae]
MMPKRLGFFTRLLDQGSAQTRYRLAAEQIRHAERVGFDSAWIAQHHFHEQEGGLPSPLVFLAHVAAQTDRIRLGTA